MLPVLSKRGTVIEATARSRPVLWETRMAEPQERNHHACSSNAGWCLGCVLSVFFCDFFQPKFTGSVWDLLVRFASQDSEACKTAPRAWKPRITALPQQPGLGDLPSWEKSGISELR